MSARKTATPRARRAAARARFELELQRRARGWSPPARDLTQWARAALGDRARGHSLGVCVVSAAESRRLNARFRGREHPTNVLSFPAAPLPDPGGGPRALGELVICPPVLRAEARSQSKPLRAHWAHMVVHGALHLAGYDHERESDARRMERREIAVLRRLGFANPYRSV
ncbi:MAG TPA: rRNA maturation RNase YbeY [Steroidobacteraceae bacterium]|nr:rRNA maturation RNase YbeY [Steroidobacteraceae bacterium]